MLTRASGRPFFIVLIAGTLMTASPSQLLLRIKIRNGFSSIPFGRKTPRLYLARRKFGRGVFGSGEDFFAFLRDSFDLLYEEGAERPRMMSIGLHMRLTGHPGRAKALTQFIQYILGHPRVWVCRREDIARHWIARFPAPS